MEDALTVSKLLDLIEKERQYFSDHLIPLSQTQVEAIKRFSAYIAKDRNAIRRNPVKKRSHLILSDFWTHIPEVFILCALATFPTKLACLDPTNCLRELLTWWESVDHPKGLTWIIEHYAQILPGGREFASTENCLPQKRHLEPATNNDDDEQRNKQSQRVKTPDSTSIETIVVQEELGCTNAGGLQREREAEDGGRSETSDGHDREIRARSIKSTKAPTASEPPIGPMYEGRATEEAELGAGPVKAGSMRVAVMPDLEKLPGILGLQLFNGMQTSSVIFGEEEEDRKEGRAPRRVTNAMRLYLARQEGEDFKLEVTLGFEMGRRIWLEAYPQI